jgi:transcriptional regulator GlxA family with amidase domain
VSTSRATHPVRELTGCSWRHLLMNRRLQLAGHLLRTTDLPLDAVAQRSGFGVRVALGRAFRQHHGTSPGRWRRQQES